MSIENLQKPNIIKGTQLRHYVDDLLDNFLGSNNLDSKQLSNFFKQDYFTGKESIIGKLSSTHTITFEDIKKEGINLGKFINSKSLSEILWDFDNLTKTTPAFFQKAFNETLQQKIQNSIGTNQPYDDFITECNIENNEACSDYINKIIKYLAEKQDEENGKNIEKIFNNITITNEDINNNLGTQRIINLGDNINNLNIDLKESFDKLLSFEIGKEIEYTEKLLENATKNYKDLFSNSLPAINTLLAKSKYKYDESKFGDIFKSRLTEIQNSDKDDNEKTKEIEDLKWQYYIAYLKNENKSLGETLEELYNNNFNFGLIDRTKLKKYLLKMSEINTKNIFINQLDKSLGIKFSNKTDFINYYKSIADPDINTLTLPNGSTISVKKTIINEENYWLKDLNSYGENAKSFDTLPIKIEIDKSEINNLNISLEDKDNLLKFLRPFCGGEEDTKYTFEKTELGSLVFLYLLLNGPELFNGMDTETTKKIKNLFGDTKKDSKNTKNNENEEENEEETEDSNQGENTENHNENKDSDSFENNESKNDTKQFIEAIEKNGPGKFENGSEICFPISDSKLPGGGYSRMRLKISDIDEQKGTFTGEGIGTEFKYSKTYKRTFNMNQEELNNINNINKGQILLLPENKSTDFKSYVSSIKDKNGNEVFQGIPELQGKHFIHEIEKDDKKTKEIINYFSTEGENPGSYKISYNPTTKTFIVASTFLGKEKNKKGNDEDVNYKYEQEMDYPSFLLFFKEKQLKPQTDEDAQIQAQKRLNDLNKIKIKNGGTRKINWFTIGNVKAAIKSIYSSIDKKLKDYNNAQNKKLEDIIIGDWGLYNGLSSVLGFIPSGKEGLGELQMDRYNDRDNRSWKKIEGYLTQLKADPDFGTTFTEEPPHVKTLYGKSLAKIIEDKVKNATDQLGDPGVHQAAALLLANIDKGGSPYRGLSGHENSGMRVKALLGNDHYNNFLKEKEKCIQARDRGEDTKGMNSLLSNCELTYIINNVNGDPSPTYFGSIEDRGTDGSKNYIDNPSKRILSSKFASELKTKIGWFSDKTINESYDGLKTNDFGQVEKEFGKMGSSRYQKGLGALRKMFDLAKSEEQIKIVKRHFLTYLLSGVLDVYSDPKLAQQTYKRAKSIGFIPGYLAKDPYVAENIAILLNDATNGDFSKNVKNYFHKKDLLTGKIPFKELEKEIDKWLNEDNYNKIEKYFRTLSVKDFSGYPTKTKGILEKFQKAALNNSRENIDTDLLNNPNLVSNGLFSDINVISKMMAIDGGEFTGKDEDEKENKAKFWKNVTKDIENTDMNEDNCIIILSKFFDRFDIDGEDTYNWIYSAKTWEEKIASNKTNEFTNPSNNNEKIQLGNISMKEINSIIRYAFKGQALSKFTRQNNIPKELNECLSAFQKFFEKAYNENILSKDKIIKKGFKKVSENITIGLCSRDIYNKGTKWADSISHPKDHKNDPNYLPWKLTHDENFINYKIHQIEDKLKKTNLDHGDYCRLPNSAGKNLEHYFSLLNN